MKFTVTYTNRSHSSVWVYGYSDTSPFIGIETRVDSNHPWIEYRQLYCGTGARHIEVDPDRVYTFDVSLPEPYFGHEFRVLLPFCSNHEGDDFIEALSEPHRLQSLHPHLTPDAK